MYTRQPKKNKSSAVAEMGDRLTTIDMSRKVGMLCRFPWGELGPHLTQCRLGRGSILSGILIHPTVGSQYTNVTDRTGQTGQTTVR